MDVDVNPVTANTWFYGSQDFHVQSRGCTCHDVWATASHNHNLQQQFANFITHRMCKYVNINSILLPANLYLLIGSLYPGRTNDSFSLPPDTYACT